MAANLTTKLMFRLPAVILYRMSGKAPISLGQRKLDPACQLICSQAGEEPLGSGEVPAEEVRRTMREVSLDLSAAPPKNPQRTEHSLKVDGGDIRIREYRPVGWQEGEPSMLYIHGGGWVLCDLDSHDGTCANIAARANCRLFSVEYRLAPENPFPVPLNDCLAAWHWMQEQMGCRAGNTAVGGDSAGGNLAAALCLSLQQSDQALPCLQFLIYPAVDAAMKTKSCKEAGKGFYLTANAMKWFWSSYQPKAKRRADPLVSPLKAKSLKGMPQAVIVTAGFDPLRDEGQAYLAKLQQDGVDCWHREYPELIHGFANMTVLPAAGRAMQECIGEVGRRLAAT